MLLLFLTLTSVVISNVLGQYSLGIHGHMSGTLSVVETIFGTYGVELVASLFGDTSSSAHVLETATTSRSTARPKLH